jgi:hypothetical protein
VARRRISFETKSRAPPARLCWLSSIAVPSRSALSTRNPDPDRDHAARVVRRYRARRPPERRDSPADFAAFSSTLSASLTAWLVGNAAATSGWRRTIFELAAIRAAYFPRTNPAGKSERTYLVRSSSERRCLAFFIQSTLRASRFSCTNDANDIVFFGVSHYEHSLLAGNAERYPSGLTDRMIRVCACDGHPVAQCRSGLFERNTMLPDIGRSFPWVPCKTHARILVEAGAGCSMDPAHQRTRWSPSATRWGTKPQAAPFSRIATRPTEIYLHLSALCASARENPV